jgi:anti-sigma factor RsiW
MKCLSEKMLQEYLDGEIPKIRRNQMKLHLTECDRCRQRAASLGATKDLIIHRLKLLDPAEMPTARVLNLTGAQSGQAHPPFFRRFFGRKVRMPVAAAAMAVLFIAGLSLGWILHSQPSALAVSSSEEGFLPLYIASNKVVMALPFKLDLTDYEPINHPGLIITQEESR